MLLIISGPAIAGKSITWKAKAIDSQSLRPIEGVTFTFDLIDETTQKKAEHTCISNHLGECVIETEMEYSWWSGGSMNGNVRFDRLGYVKDATYKWFSIGLNKRVEVTMTSQQSIQDELNRKQELANEKLQLANEREDLLLKISVAENESVITCSIKSACEKMFALTEIYISKTSDMKIQLATTTTIETFNPTETYKLGLSAIKLPSKGTSSIIKISATCKDQDHSSPLKNNICLKNRLDAIKNFKPFIDSLFSD